MLGEIKKSFAILSCSSQDFFSFSSTRQRRGHQPWMLETPTRKSFCLCISLPAGSPVNTSFQMQSAKRLPFPTHVWYEISSSLFRRVLHVSFQWAAYHLADFFLQWHFRVSKVMGEIRLFRELLTPILPVDHHHGGVTSSTTPPFRSGSCWSIISLGFPISMESRLFDYYY